jgi:post-segregation antitoxin (ccd killing protein)
MRMARVNVYLPDDLASEVREAGLNVSNVAQEALRSALAAGRVNGWLDDLAAMRPLGINHDAVVEAVSAAKDDLEHRA